MTLVTCLSDERLKAPLKFLATGLLFADKEPRHFCRVKMDFGGANEIISDAIFFGTFNN